MHQRPSHVAGDLEHRHGLLDVVASGSVGVETSSTFNTETWIDSHFRHWICVNLRHSYTAQLELY